MYLNIIFTFLFSLLLFSCTKALKKTADYAPKVEMTSVEALANGNIRLEGTVISNGKYKDAATDYVGFCFTYASKTPTLSDNQISTTRIGNRFSVECPPDRFSEDSTYNISAWSTNGITYAVSTPLKVSKLFYDIIPTCTLDSNWYQFQNSSSGNLEFYALNEYFSTYEIIYASKINGDEISLKFYGKPNTRIYSSSNTLESNSSTVIVSVYKNGSYTMEAGQDVFVKKVGNSYDITICNGKLVHHSFPDLYLNTRIVTHP